MLPIPGTGVGRAPRGELRRRDRRADRRAVRPPHRRRAVGRAAGPLRSLVVMAQLRIGLAQVDPTVGDLPGNARPRQPLDRAGGRRRAATSWRSPRWCSPATRRRTSCCGTRSCRPAWTRSRRWPCGWPTRALATSRSSSATAAHRAAGAGARAGRPASRRTARPCCTAAGSSRATPSTTCRTTASSTSSATSCAATGCPSSGCTASTSRRSSARTSGRRAGRSQVACAADAGLVVCINGSPYERGKDDLRAPLAARRAAEAGAPVAYVNCVGGQDELVFDGDSFVVDASARSSPGRRGGRSRCWSSTSTSSRRRSRGHRSARRRRRHDHDRRAGGAVCGAAAGLRPAGADGRGAARRPRRGVGRAGHRDPRLRREEPLPLGRARAVRRHRLRTGRDDRPRRARRGPGARGRDAERVVARTTR